MNPLLLQALWPLHFACANADLGAVKALLRSMDEEDVFRRINERIKAGGHTPLHVLFHSMVQTNSLSGPRSADYFAVLTYLVSQGARLDIEDHEQCRPAAFLEGRTTPALQRYLEQQQGVLDAELNDASKKEAVRAFRKDGKNWEYITATLKCSEDAARKLDRQGDTYPENLGRPNNRGLTQHRINPRVRKQRVLVVPRAKRESKREPLTLKVAAKSINLDTTA